MTRKAGGRKRCRGAAAPRPMMRVPREELLVRLQEQVQFLQDSARAFDEGREAEAKRLAVAIRVLVHDTQASRSLLGQLGLKGSLSFRESLAPDPPGNLLPFCGLVGLKIRKGEAAYFAHLDDGPPFPVVESGFAAWWSRYVIRDQEASRFTRRDLVLALANKEGGAHVDPELNREYARLSRENSLRWCFSVDGAARNWSTDPVPHTVRHIAHELLAALFAQVPSARAEKPHGWGWRINGLPAE